VKSDQAARKFVKGQAVLVSNLALIFRYDRLAIGYWLYWPKISVLFITNDNDIKIACKTITEGS